MSQEQERSGRVLFYRQGTGFTGGIIVDEGRKGFQVLDVEGRTEAVAANQVALLSESQDPDHVGAVLAALARVDLRTGWELLVESDDGPVYTDDLVDLCATGETLAEEEAVRLALQGAQSPFKRKGEGWIALSAKVVREREEQAARAREKEEAFGRVVEELRRLDGRTLAAEELTPPARAALLAVRRCAIEGEVNATAEKVLEAVVGDARNVVTAAFEWLVKLALFEPHEDLNLARLGATEQFPDEVLANARELADRALEKSVERELVNGVRLFAIDDPETVEVDDALGVEVLEKGYRIHVAICDVAAAVPAGSPVDLEALQRATTIYHPARRIPMLPPLLSSEALSLVEGEPRLVLDHVFHVDERFGVYDVQVVPALVSLTRRLSYEEADVLLAVDGPEDPDRAALRICRRVAETLFNERVNQGAIHFYPPEAKIRVGEDGRVHVKSIDNFSPARRLVSEYMVACGAAVGRLLAEQSVPAIFRKQAPPSEPVEWDEESARDPLFMQHNVRKLKRAELSLVADRHHALGLMAYTQVTSPLRRYGDLLMQRQLHSFLVRRVAAYGDGELLQLMSQADQVALQVRRAVADAERYWALEALEQRAGEPVHAIVLRTDRRGATVLLPDFGVTGKLHARSRLEEGDELTLRVVKARGRSDTLVLSDEAVADGNQ